jgi:hypothetical protein
MTYGSVQRATKLLKLHPYGVQACHELKEIDKEKRMRYCRWFRQFVRNGVDILENGFFFDDAWFHLSGYVNSQNSRFWSSENPHLLHEVPLHSHKIGCWCATSRKRIVGHIFFSETITAEKIPRDHNAVYFSVERRRTFFLGFSRMALPRILLTQQRKCLSSSLIIG